jgi:hypothetical protein
VPAGCASAVTRAGAAITDEDELAITAVDDSEIVLVDVA